MRVELAGEVDFDGWRRKARELLAQQVAPDDVEWSVVGRAELAWAARAASNAAVDGQPASTPGPGHAESATATAAPDAAFSPSTAAALSTAAGSVPDLWTDAPPNPAVPATAAASPGARVPAAFIGLCREVALHREPQRYTLLYRLLWRLQHEPTLRDDPLDEEMSRAQLMAQAVRRDLHKMKAFVRFREVTRGDGESPLHVAWFEPEHHIVEAVAPFFARRFAGMEWAVLTPERCVRWDGGRLEFTPGAGREDAPPADAGESLWLTYYASIFNPARLKLRAMQKEMPRRYWHNLPEAELISGLSAAAAERSVGMIDRAPTVPPPAVQRQQAAAAMKRASREGPAIIPIEPGPVLSRAGAPPGGDIGEPVPVGQARQWLAQRDAASVCRECPIGALATQTVWGEGPLGARLMLVGEQPGDQEDLQGRPFVGPAGQLLARAMAELGWDRGAMYVTNAVKHFKYEPRGKRRVHKTPAQREAEACLHWLESEIATVAPQAIVALGATAARQLLGRPVAVTRERGQWLQRADGVPVLVTLHPSALLRTDAPDRDAAYAAWMLDLHRADAIALAPS